jgi:hypothetical protein
MAAAQGTQSSQDYYNEQVKTRDVESENTRPENFEKNVHEHESGSVLDTSAAQKAATDLDTITITDNQHEEELDDDGNYLNGFAMWMLAIALMFGVFVMALDNNIICKDSILRTPFDLTVISLLE